VVNGAFLATKMTLNDKKSLEQYDCQFKLYMNIYFILLLDLVLNIALQLRFIAKQFVQVTL
jgi:hypothetical protein